MKDIELFNDNFQNWKRYAIPKAQLIIADVPYNLSNNAYASNPSWYVDGDNRNGESDKAGKAFFDTDKDFRPAEFMHFCSQLLVKEPKEKGKAPCMIIFCEFEDQFRYIELGRRYGLKNYINRRLIEIFTDRGDVVIDPCAGSGSTLLAAAQCGRRAYGFEIKKDFYQKANRFVLSRIQQQLFQ